MRGSPLLISRTARKLREEGASERSLDELGALGLRALDAGLFDDALKALRLLLSADSGKGRHSETRRADATLRSLTILLTVESTSPLMPCSFACVSSSTLETVAPRFAISRTLACWCVIAALGEYAMPASSFSQ